MWEKCPEKSSRKIPGKILQNLYDKNPRHISAEGPGQDFAFAFAFGRPLGFRRISSRWGGALPHEGLVAEKFVPSKVCLPWVQRTAKGASGKGPRQKTSKIVKKCQRVFRHFSTLFDIFRAGQKTSKIVKKCQKVFRHFLTIFARHPVFRPLLGGSDGFRREESGMSREFCRDVPDPWGCSKGLCQKKFARIFRSLISP